MVEEVGLVGITRQPLMLTKISYSFISQHIKSAYSYNYEVSGNIFSGRTLKLINGDEVMEFTQADNSYALDPDDDFKLNNGVVGEWNADGNIVYTFTKDGRFLKILGIQRQRVLIISEKVMTVTTL